MQKRALWNTRDCNIQENTATHKRQHCGKQLGDIKCGPVQKMIWVFVAETKLAKTLQTQPIEECDLSAREKHKSQLRTCKCKLSLYRAGKRAVWLKVISDRKFLVWKIKTPAAKLTVVKEIDHYSSHGIASIIHPCILMHDPSELSVSLLHIWKGL